MKVYSTSRGPGQGHCALLNEVKSVAEEAVVRAMDLAACDFRPQCCRGVLMVARPGLWHRDGYDLSSPGEYDSPCHRGRNWYN